MRAMLASINKTSTPHLADPRKFRGDPLAEQGNSEAALVKYNEALKDAPR